MISKKIANQIRNLVAQAKLDQALDLFIKSDFTKGTEIKKRLEDAQLRSEKGQITYGDYNITRNQIVDSLLKALDSKPTSARSNNYNLDADLLDLLRGDKPQRMLSSAEKTRIKELLDKNELEQALIACYDLGNKFIALASSYTKIKRDDHLGLITTSQRNTAIEEIKKAINEVVKH